MIDFKDTRWVPLEEGKGEAKKGVVTYINDSSYITIKLKDYSGKEHYLSVTKQYTKDFANALLARVEE